jgi:hypothetical protein
MAAARAGSGMLCWTHARLGGAAQSMCATYEPDMPNGNFPPSLPLRVCSVHAHPQALLHTGPARHVRSAARRPQQSTAARQRPCRGIRYDSMREYWIRFSSLIILASQPSPQLAHCRCVPRLQLCTFEPSPLLPVDYALRLCARREPVRLRAAACPTCTRMALLCFSCRPGV